MRLYFHKTDGGATAPPTGGMRWKREYTEKAN